MYLGEKKGEYSYFFPYQKIVVFFNVSFIYNIFKGTKRRKLAFDSRLLCASPRVRRFSIVFCEIELKTIKGLFLSPFTRKN